jgi:putative peptidoglycan lipid II flippase
MNSSTDENQAQKPTKKVSLLQAGSIVSAMTMISRVLGLVRDLILANLLGATLAADVFLFAQKIPNFLRRLFAEGAFSQAFVPVLKEYQHLHSHELLMRFVNRIAGTLGVILLLVTIVGVLGSTGLVSLFGYGFIGQPEKFELANLLLKITFPYILFISLAGLCGSLLNSIHQYAVPAITPVLLNLSLISAAIFVAPVLAEPAVALAWAIFIAGILQLLWQLPFLWRANLLPRPEWGWGDKGVKKVLKLMGPALFGVSVSQINLLIDTMLATSLITGSISWLYYADRLLEFPLGVIGIALATVILPNLSQQHVESSTVNFNRMLDWALRLVLLIGLPATLGLVLLSEPLMLSLFQHGNFSLDDAARASYALVAYSLGLPCFMLIKILATAYYSRQDTKTPVKIGIIAMVSNIVLNLILYKPFGHVGLALATSIAAALNAGLLYRGLRKTDSYQPLAGWWPWLGKLAFGLGVMSLIIVIMTPDIGTWQAWQSFERVFYLLPTILAAVVGFIISLLLVGVRPKDLKQEIEH